MDLLDRLLGHDAWTTRQLLDRCSNLFDMQLDREFDFAHRTVRATFEHIIRNMEVWSDLMDGKPVDWPTAHRCTIAEFTDRLNLAAANLARVARDVARRNAWDECWLDTSDDPPTEKTYGAAIAHILTHSMHHRAQLLYMLRLLDISPLPEGDVFSWENRHASPFNKTSPS
jgi:uncharacterized damage-inducible protein DinB